MARNNNKLTRRKKTEPAVMSMFFQLPPITADTAQTFYIDLSQCASLLNRRFYRQGINWAVAGLKLSSDYQGFSWCNKLPTTWVMSNAWEKGFRAWQKMNNEAADETQSVKPRFLDFKIYANSGHHDAGFDGNLLPVAADYLPATPGEWVASKFVVPSGGTLNVSSREVIAVGPNYPGNSTATGLNAVSLIEGYAASRALPSVVDPNVPDDAASTDGLVPANWIQALFNQGTEQSDEVLGDMISENNQAPYPYEGDGVATDTQYPGGANQLASLEIHDTGLMTQTTIGGETYYKGGMFPCGLIEFIVGVSPDTTNTGGWLQIDLVPGDHRGYLCEPMTEM